ncbi:hypothetical protein [uncultured Maritalea sp.]|jgi:hypothetical protein|uniref:hypothetical protein n=1 Tax=uncultured Maritalea sp. TaxID=757249 RepID=UPI0026039E5C|nr:hypothetical protein [uncultured Maritalea sp.]
MISYVKPSLIMLIVLQLTMIFSLFFKVPPHPPIAIPISGIGPLIGVSIGVALMAILIDPAKDRVARILSVIAVALALISYGPHKYIDPQFPLIWPAVIAAQLASLVILVGVAYKRQGA